MTAFVFPSLLHTHQTHFSAHSPLLSIGLLRIRRRPGHMPRRTAQCMRLRRRQAATVPARRDRPRSPYPHRSLRRKRSLIRLYRAFPRSKVGGYEGIRMMKYDSETSYDRVACPPSYLIFPEITNSSIVVSRKKCGGREIFCALPAVGHGSTISVGLAAGTDAAAANLARAAL
jgi:hypothetical protein